MLTILRRETGPGARRRPDRAEGTGRGPGGPGHPGAATAELDTATAAALPADRVMAALGTGPDGLSTAEAAARLRSDGPNAVVRREVRLAQVVAAQVRSPLLALLLGTAAVSALVGERTNAAIIALILVASVGLGSGNEYRAARTARSLQDAVRRRAGVTRGGVVLLVDARDLVLGDLVHLAVGSVVPADLRLVRAEALSCDESVLTGEAEAVDKTVDPVPSGTALPELRCCALMGTVVRTGAGEGVVVATARGAEFGRVAARLGDPTPETAFQAGLRQFSVLLVQIAVAVSGAVFVTSLVLRRPVLDALLFATAIAVGITPQLLPAVVSTSLATGSRALARKEVLVKRLVCIEDLGDLDVLVTDKTGTLTSGRFTLTGSVPVGTHTEQDVRRLALLASEHGTGAAATTDALDLALWAASADVHDAVLQVPRTAALPFDHVRRAATALVRLPDGTGLVVTKGAPESVLPACVGVTDATRARLDALFSSGARVIAVASRPVPGSTTLTPAEVTRLDLAGLLVFADPVKADAPAALARLAALGVRVVVATGDNALTAAHAAQALGLLTGPTVDGRQMDEMDDERLGVVAATSTVFARVTPEQKARLVLALRSDRRAAGFLGDGVNDALALHAADVGVSVDTAADVAKDAADVLLLKKSLSVLADGVVEGRRIFANTIKYVLMGTSSNFGNIFSAAAASALLPFLPLLPSQLLLNNLVYDCGQLTIPTDRVDEEQLTAPAQWDLRFIRRFMFFFGPLSSLFDFITFGVLLGAFHAGPALFRTGWFLESLVTQPAVVLVVRTRRVPFLRSRPSAALALSVLGVLAVAVAIPLSPLSSTLGFVRPSLALYGAVAVMLLAYAALIDLGKSVFYARPADRGPHPRRDVVRAVYRGIEGF